MNINETLVYIVPATKWDKEIYGLMRIINAGHGEVNWSLKDLDEEKSYFEINPRTLIVGVAFVSKKTGHLVWGMHMNYYESSIIEKFMKRIGQNTDLIPSRKEYEEKQEYYTNLLMENGGTTIIKKYLRED